MAAAMTGTQAAEVLNAHQLGAVQELLHRKQGHGDES
jgi:hypothetical protein